MCGRARLNSDVTEIGNGFAVPPGQPRPNLEPRWNLAPMQRSAIVRLDEAGRRLIDLAQWSLLPAWAKEPKLRYATFNARAIDAKGVTVDHKPSFRDPFRRRRCLVPLDAFYEWRQHDPPDKQPFAIARADGALLALAGLWDEWHGSGAEVIRSFTIITTEPNEPMARIHDRMPVILAPPDWPAWLGETPATTEQLRALLRPCPGDSLVVWPIDRRVGNVRNDAPALVGPLRPPEPEPRKSTAGDPNQGALAPAGVGRRGS